MKKWEVTLRVRGVRVKHVVRADDADAAVERAMRAYPAEVVMTGWHIVKQLGEASQ